MQLELWSLRLQDGQLTQRDSTLFVPRKQDIIRSFAKEKSIQELQRSLNRFEGSRAKNIHRLLKSTGAKAFHQIPALKPTEKNVKD